MPSSLLLPMKPTGGSSSPLHFLIYGLVAIQLVCLQHESGVLVAACPDTCVCNKGVVLCQKGDWADIEPRLALGLEMIVMERDVTNLDTIRDSTLLKFKDSLKMLKIKGLSLKTIEPYAFAGFSSLVDLDLSSNRLTDLDPNSFYGLSSLKSLNLAENNLDDLEDVLAPLMGLKTLDVSRNSIKDLSKSVFKNQSSLTMLKLNGNDINRLTAQAFTGLRRVQEIQLQDCKLLTVDIDVFFATPKLNSLDLSQNRFSKALSQATFVDLLLLKKLLLGHNKFSSLKHQDFAHLNLQTLDLSFNRITNIEKTAFQNLTVEELDLSDNLILSLTPNFLHPLSSHLTSLTLAGNPFEKLGEDTFSDFTYLKRLNLSSCRLNSLTSKTLHRMPALKELDLSHNNLHFLSQETVSGFNSLALVNLHKNSWICDCQIKPLWNWLSKAESSAKMQCPPSRGKHQDCNILRCAAPSQLYQKQLHQIQEFEDEQDCLAGKDDSGLPASTQGAIVAACLGFAIIFLLITVYLWRKGKTGLRLKRVCVPSHAESSHMVDEDSKVPPLSNCDRASLNESDHEFVVRHYFDTLVTDPKLMSRTSDSEEPKSPKERDSMYSSQPSLYNSDLVTAGAAYGVESTV